MMFIMYLTFTLCKVDGLSGSEVTVYLCLAYTVDGLLGIVVVILNFYTNPEVCESDSFPHFTFYFHVVFWINVLLRARGEHRQLEKIIMDLYKFL